MAAHALGPGDGAVTTGVAPGARERRVHSDELVWVRGAPEARRGVAVLALRDARAVGALGGMAAHALGPGDGAVTRGVALGARERRVHSDELVWVRGAPEARRGVAVLALRDARAVGAVGRVAGHALVAAASADLGELAVVVALDAVGAHAADLGVHPGEREARRGVLERRVLEPGARHEGVARRTVRQAAVLLAVASDADLRSAGEAAVDVALRAVELGVLSPDLEERVVRPAGLGLLPPVVGRVAVLAVGQAAVVGPMAVRAGARLGRRGGVLVAIEALEVLVSAKEGDVRRGEGLADAPGRRGVALDAVRRATVRRVVALGAQGRRKGLTLGVAHGAADQRVHAIVEARVDVGVDRRLPRLQRMALLAWSGVGRLVLVGVVTPRGVAGGPRGVGRVLDGLHRRGR